MATSRKLSLGTVMVLHALARGSRYGFDIMEDTGLTSGTIYPALERLEQEGFAKGKWEEGRIAQKEGRPARRYYEITPRGVGFLQDALARYRSLAPVNFGALQPKRP